MTATAVEDTRKVHWHGANGRLLHPMARNASRAPLTSGDEDEVTCRRCLHFLGRPLSTTPVVVTLPLDLDPCCSTCGSATGSDDTGYWCDRPCGAGPWDLYGNPDKDSNR